MSKENGFIITRLKEVSHEKGNILHVIKNDSIGFYNFGEAYFSEIISGEVKGWKLHTEMIVNVVVPIGEVLFVIFGNKKFHEIILSRNNYQRLTILPNFWFAFKGLSASTSTILNVASIQHNPEESRTCKLEDFDYKWRK